MGMDKKIEKKVWTRKRIGLAAGATLIVAFSIYSFVFAGAHSTLNVDREKLNISTVRQGSFHDFMQVDGIVQPIQTIYLDAIEGGVVEQIYRESGTMVKRGDTILVLSNSDLRLRVLQQSSAIYDQINQTRNSRLNIEQNSLSLKERLVSAESQLKLAKAAYERRQKLYDQKLIAEQMFLETKEKFEYRKERYNLIYESFKQDSLKVKQQLRQIDESLNRMWQSLRAVHEILDRLVVTAPISGQLSTIELNPGQSIASGERIGQVDILNNFKVRVHIDEYYLAQISTGLRGTVNFGGTTYTLEITKFYPVVKNGQFQVDMEFTDKVPSNLTRGQTLRIKLKLSDSSREILLARGGFYQSTAGDWIYKISGDGSRAIKQKIELGRQNIHYFEVLSGLQPGDKVITSDYSSFGNNEELVLE